MITDAGVYEKYQEKVELMNMETASDGETQPQRARAQQKASGEMQTKLLGFQ